MVRGYWHSWIYVRIYWLMTVNNIEIAPSSLNQVVCCQTLCIYPLVCKIITLTLLYMLLNLSVISFKSPYLKPQLCCSPQEQITKQIMPYTYGPNCIKKGGQGESKAGQGRWMAHYGLKPLSILDQLSKFQMQAALLSYQHNNVSFQN